MIWKVARSDTPFVHEEHTVLEQPVKECGMTEAANPTGSDGIPKMFDGQASAAKWRLPELLVRYPVGFLEERNTS
ncbi:hypothetical protein [Pararhizobium sp. O133]|uniref:hypothetical protein n=1 Tax=Pararhizobium sp. O133 TaxID=3449278 RepID=UPI003F689089